MTFLDKIKQKIWHFIYKFFPTVQSFFLRFHEKGRQRYHIGWLAPDKSLEDLKHYLHDTWGFGNHFVAWPDDGQVLSWRKLADFNDQYHLRVFRDGEIRGHYEYTPEAHPLAHFDEKDEQFKKEDFLKFLDGYIVDKKFPRHLEADPDAYNPNSEVSFENQN